MACHDHTHEISERGPNNLPVCSMKDVQCWSHMFTLTTDGNYVKTLSQSVQKRRLERKGEEKKAKTTRMGIAKFFTLNANAKNK